jgi:RNA polymerase sigma-70 factor (ECF subfamily)
VNTTSRGSQSPSTGAPHIALVSSLSSDDRVRSAVRANYEFLWRLLRRLGVAPAAVEDSVQQVLVVFHRKIDAVHIGAERAFLFATATRVASDYRKKQKRSPEVVDSPTVDREPCPSLSADDLIDRGRARELLDVILADMPLDLRTVFVLFELEGMTMATIAELTNLAPGTVASRLRRARAMFKSAADRWQRCKVVPL